MASLLLNLVMFGISLIAALGTAFLAGPDAGRRGRSPGRRWRCSPGRSAARPSCSASGSAWSPSAAATSSLAGLAQLLVVRVDRRLLAAAAGHRRSRCSPRETIVLLTLALLLSSVISPMASGIVAVGLFGATWVAGVVGGIGAALGNEGVARVGTVSRMLLPTDGLWRGAMNAFQDPSALRQIGPAAQGGFPFLSARALTPAYLAWAAVWIAVIWGLTALSFSRRDV